MFGTSASSVPNLLRIRSQCIRATVHATGGDPTLTFERLRRADVPDVARVEQGSQIGRPLARGLFFLLARQRVDRGTLHRAQHAHGLRERRLECGKRHGQRQVVARLVVDERTLAQRTWLEAEAVADAQRLVLRLPEDERLAMLELDERIVAHLALGPLVE